MVIAVVLHYVAKQMLSEYCSPRSTRRHRVAVPVAVQNRPDQFQKVRPYPLNCGEPS